MLRTVLAIALSTTVDPVCSEDDGMCLLQFMKRETASEDPPPQSMDDLLNGGFDFDGLVKNPQHEKECPGKAIVEHSDAGHCSHQGVDVNVNGKDIAEFFGDNVMMKNFKYYLEECTSGMCEDNELIDPDISMHRFQVGKSHVKVEGYDLAGNVDHCYRTVYVYDSEDPVFSNPDTDVDGVITAVLSEDACEVEAGAPFASYEALGFDSSATDNCDNEVDIVKKVYDESGTCVYDSSKDTVTMTLPLGPGTYHMTYEAIDDHQQSLDLPDATVTMRTTTHTVTLHLTDETPPYNFTGCPTEPITVIIEPHETEGQVDWTPPTVTGDACGNVGEAYAEEQSAPQKYPGMMMEVGSHMVRYAFKDVYGNTMEEECMFEVHVVQKAHPVTVVCPDDVTVPTVENARAGVVTWVDPVATQGENTLDATHIAYPQGVSSGMMFPFGVTTVTVNATGAVTGTRVDEHLQFDECTFQVTVTDPFDPKVDGREYRCKNPESTDVKPYRICDGPDLSVHLHQTYLSTFGYDTIGVLPKASLSCCESEDDTLHECVEVPGSSKNKYCKPM